MRIRGKKKSPEKQGANRLTFLDSAKIGIP